MYDRPGLEKAGMDWSRPVVAAVWLSTKEKFETEPRVLAARLSVR
jgi:hypothetical protein